MIIHNINPVFFNIGPLQIRYYSLVYFTGFLFLYFYFRYLVKKGTIRNMNYEQLDLFTIYFMLGAIIGARVLDFVFFNTSIIFTDPAEILKVWHGGMSIHGGIIGAMGASYLFTRKYKIKFYELADHVIIPLMIFLGIGRIANFINGELWGTTSSAKMCIDYTQNQFISNAPPGCRHPYTIYESLKNFAVAAILIAVKAKTKLKSGLLFWYGIFLYNFLRFFIDFYRDAGEPRLFIGLSMTQYLCIIFAIISGISIYLLNKNAKQNQETEQNIKIKTKNKRNR